jgi:SAM-dependent methyltransferase
VTGVSAAPRDAVGFLRRSAALFRAFGRGKSESDHRCTQLARVAVDQVERHTERRGRIVVDVGGGAGHVTEEFRRRGAHAFLFEPDLRELTGHGPGPGYAVQADGYLLPLPDGAADVCFSSHVLEHVSDPQTFLSELVRVTRPGGLIYLSFTYRWAPWGGHEPEHTRGDNLFRLPIGRTLRRVQARRDVEVVSARSRIRPCRAALIPRLRPCARSPPAMWC